MQAPVGVTQSSGHSLTGTGAKGDGRDKREPGPLSRRPRALPMACPGHTGRWELEEGKVLHLHCLYSGASLAVSTLRKKISTTDTRARSSLTKAEVILLTWSFL